MSILLLQITIILESTIILLQYFEMVLKDYVCCLKGKFEMAQKGDRAAASYLMKALSLK